MKLSTQDQNVEVCGTQEAQSFSIEASAKAFLILSDSLYSKKIRAVIRELSTNADDSYVGIERTRQFEVHLPSSLEPFFSIRDYGVGMSHEDCMSLYTTYFRSTKNNDNNSIGCLGLGSKSPFAYTDSFTVESFFNGVKRIYVGYKTNNGPKFDLMSEESTSEHNGILVRVPVQEYDFYEFKEEAKNIYRNFKNKPVFVGREVQIETPVPTISGTSWAYYENEYENYVVMGQVAYPIDSSRFGDHPEIKDFLSNITGLYLNSNIGDLDITPSRESLSYNKTTIDNLAKITYSILDHINKEVNGQLESQPSLYEARKAYIGLNESLVEFCTDITWKGISLFSDVKHKSISLVGDLTVDRFFKWNKKKPSREIVTSGIVKFIHRLKNYYILNDLPLTDKTSASRVNNYLNSIYSGYGYGSTSEVYLFCGKKEDLLKTLGTDDESVITLVSSLPKPTYANNTVVGSIPCLHLVDNKFEDSKMSVKYENAIYFAESRGRIQIKHRTVSVAEFERLVNFLSDSGYEFDGDVYTVKPSVIVNQKLNSRKNWRNGEELLTEMYVSLAKELEEDFVIAQRKISFENYSYANSVFKDPNHPVRRLASEYSEYNKLYHKSYKAITHITQYKQYFDYITFDSPLPYDPEYFNKSYESLTKKYSHLDKFKYYESAAREYIDMVDELCELREKVQNLELVS
jgi:hypothetical protein